MFTKKRIYDETQLSTFPHFLGQYERTDRIQVLREVTKHNVEVDRFFFFGQKQSDVPTPKICCEEDTKTHKKHPGGFQSRSLAVYSHELAENLQTRFGFRKSNKLLN